MTKLGHYTLHEELGHGSFATVYRATHGALGNQVAIKVLSMGLSGDDIARKRFTQEAQAASVLEHPHIVRILDLDEDDGQVFIAMEYVAGSNLKKRLAEPTSLTQKDIFRILGQVSEALDYAHSMSILHRDVKPENILLALDGSAHLSDFGLVGVAEAAHLGSVAGNAAYISPEQAEGKTPDGRSDQYSLAVLAYELLVGELPFKGDSSTATALLHVTRQPPNPRSINPQLADEVSEVLLKGLAKDPANRYTSCSDFTQTLVRTMEEGQHRQYRELIAESRSLLENGQISEARARLDMARKLLLERPELQDSISELEAASETAENYEQMLADWQTAQQEARNVLEVFPDYPDSEGIFVFMGLRKAGWSLPAPSEMILQTGLGLLLGLPLLGLIITLTFRWITR